ncbi:hypothetical protein F2P56_001035 [Juglans regia]|uniref:Pectinesterase inhibitor domain-containing protein n=2 Tax=Juglans regia TaxID=51240 RepID=A0A833XYD3_JUGRE|nr:pectinesterase inhibitor 4-like [Juglans regia]KAF5480272.1 hypothetical protein F2P56_001035 [Juglans regia]
MEAYTLTILFMNLLLVLSNIHTTLAAVSTKNYKTHIKTVCSSTTYPQVCYGSLSPYASKIKANPQKLCNTALSVAIKAARSASSTISKLSKKKGLTRSEAAVIKDCVENIKDTVDELKHSLKEMGNLGGSDVQVKIDNIKTWVSAAITDEGTCTDGFSGQRVSTTLRNKIRVIILNVARPTSNALSLINTLYSYS